jgi:hypothetical protein
VYTAACASHQHQFERSPQFLKFGLYKGMQYKAGAMMRTQLLRFNGAVERDPAIDAWLNEHACELGAIARRWFEVMRKSGDEVRELLHDGCPVACLGDAPFAYVNVFTSHVNVGFFQGEALHDPARLLQGNGKFAPCKAEAGNAHRQRSAKQAHRRGVLGY